MITVRDYVDAQVQAGHVSVGGPQLGGQARAEAGEPGRRGQVHGHLEHRVDMSMRRHSEILEDLRIRRVLPARDGQRRPAELAEHVPERGFLLEREEQRQRLGEAADGAGVGRIAAVLAQRPDGQAGLAGIPVHQDGEGGHQHRLEVAPAVPGQLGEVP